MNVCLIQFDIVWEQRAVNHAKVREMVQQAMPEPGSLLVLPEMFATGFSMKVERTAQSSAREDETLARELASQWQCGVLAGVVSRGEDGKARNETVVFSPEGRELARYSKQQPFSFAGEADVHAAGEGAVVFEFAGFKIAPLICYDLRFPEHFRAALDLGAEVFVVIASWPSRRQRHWEVLLQARAIENQAYVIGVNRSGQDPNATYDGGSVVIDPLGQSIAHAGSGTGTTEVWIERDSLLRWREQFPAWKDRKGVFRRPT